MNNAQMALILILPVLLLPVTAAADDALRIQGQTMGTYYSVIVDAPPPDADAGDLKKQVEDALQTFSRQMSTWDPGSEISRFNEQKSTEWFAVSPDLVRVVLEARRVHRLSDGLFDPTVAPLIELWGFGRNKRRVVPKADQIEQALRTVGLQHLEIRQEPAALRKLIPELQINLSAIAPGFAIDLVADLLESQGFRAWLVDIGGEARAGDRKRTGAAWKIAVESPLGNLHKVLELERCSVATSGDYRNYFELNGRRYSHILDPRSGWPIENPPASVSVLCDNSMTADALATVLMALGTQDGLAFAEQQKLDVMFLDVDASGRLRETSRGRFAELQVLAAEGSAPPGPSEGSAVNRPENETPPAAADAPETVSETSTASAWWLPFASALGVFLLAMVAMSVGVLFRHRELKGTCGGLAALSDSHGQSPCELCTQPKENCVNPSVRERWRGESEVSGDH